MVLTVVVNELKNKRISEIDLETKIPRVDDSIIQFNMINYLALGLVVTTCKSASRAFFPTDSGESNFVRGLLRRIATNHSLFLGDYTMKLVTGIRAYVKSTKISHSDF